MNNLEIRLFKNWWLLLLKGMLILIYGGIFIASFWVSLLNTAPNYKVLIYTYIFISIINGVLILFGTFFYRKNNSHWLYWLLEGSFDFIIGVAGTIGILILGVLKPHVFNIFFIQIISIWALFHGMIHFFSARRLRAYVPSSKISIYSSLTVIILSIALLLKPFFSMAYDNIYTGIFLIIIGALLMIISINLRRVYSD